MRLRLQRLGIPDLNGRSRALRELLLQALPSVVAAMLGYGPNHAELIAREAGTTWKHYTAGQRDRPSRPGES